MSQQEILIAVTGGVALIAIALAVWALVVVRRLKRDLLLARGRDGETSFVDAVARHVEQTGALREDVAKVQQQLALAQRDVSAALRHVAVVRFDAFGDMGGRMSFAAALLDDNGDGLLVTSIHGHTESRTYVKTVTQRVADGRTSPEELEAIERARPVNAK